MKSVLRDSAKVCEKTKPFLPQMGTLCNDDRLLPLADFRSERDLRNVCDPIVLLC